MNELPNWVHWLQALSVPAIAFAGVLIAASNYLLARKRRQDELFDRRYKLFKEIVDLVASEVVVRPGSTGNHDPFLKMRQEHVIEEARFLFGEDIAEHIKNYEVPTDRAYLAPGTVPSDFVRPFQKYLGLDK